MSEPVGTDDRAEGPSLARATALMVGGTIVSRATGVVRLAVIAAVFGVTETRLADTYNLANTAPNILYELVLGGVITSVFVPLFVELLKQEDRDEAWDVISGILNLSLLILSVVAIIGVLLSPWIAGFYSARLDGPEAALQRDAITFLLRLFIPQVVLYGLYFVLAAVLNANRRFAAPMYTPILNNVVLIAVLVFFGQKYGSVDLASVTDAQLLLLGLGTTLSVAPMGLALIPAFRKLGRYRLTLRARHPSVRKLARLAIYGVGFIAANQVGYVVIQWLANGEQGGYTAYLAAFTFFLLPVGLFVWAVTSALVPSMSGHALDRDWEAFTKDVSTGLRAILLLVLPCAVGFFVLARPLVEVFLEHGVVTATSSDLVAGVLRFFVLSLVQFSVFQLLVRAFYSMQDAKTPFVVNCFVIALNMAINIPMYAWLGVEGLAGGQAIAYTAGMVGLAVVLRRRVGRLDMGRVLASGWRVVVASLVMGALVWATWRGVADVAPGSDFAADALELMAPVVVGTAAYFGVAALLRVEELSFLKGLLRRRGAGAA